MALLLALSAQPVTVSDEEALRSRREWVRSRDHLVFCVAPASPPGRLQRLVRRREVVNRSSAGLRRSNSGDRVVIKFYVSKGKPRALKPPQCPQCTCMRGAAAMRAWLAGKAEWSPPPDPP